MTSKVQMTAHCGKGTALRVQFVTVVGVNSILLKDGESHEVDIYDDREVRVREVPCEVEEDAVVGHDPKDPTPPDANTGLTGNAQSANVNETAGAGTASVVDPLGGTPGPTEGPGGPGTLSQEALDAHAEFATDGGANPHYDPAA